MQKSPESLAQIIRFLLIFQIIFILLFAPLGTNLFANEKDDLNIIFLKKKLKEIIPKYNFDSIKPSPITNIYEVVYGGEVIYVTHDAKYIFEGGNLQRIILEKEKYYFKNLTELSEKQGRKILLDKIPDSKLFVFGKNSSNYITVITDIECPYCRKFHKDIPIFLDNNVKVRYLVFAIKPSTKKKIISAWCSDDKNSALSSLKNEEKIPNKDCKNPIEEHQELINTIGIKSTPSIFLPDGSLIQGYVKSKEIIKKINNQKTSSSDF